MALVSNLSWAERPQDSSENGNSKKQQALNANLGQCIVITVARAYRVQFKGKHRVSLYNLFCFFEILFRVRVGSNEWHQGTKWASPNVSEHSKVAAGRRFTVITDTL